MGPEAQRIGYELTHGFALYTDIGDRVFNLARRTELSAVTYEDIPEFQREGFRHEVRENPSSMGLYAAMQSLAQTVPLPKFEHIDVHREMLKRNYPYDLSAKDIERLEDPALFGLGLKDIRFVYQYAPLMAVVAYDWLIEKGFAHEKPTSLSTWADIISTPWFHKFMDDTASTGPTVHLGFGEEPVDYSLTSARKHYKDLLPNSDLLQLANKKDPNQPYPALSVTPEFSHGLILKMRGWDGSVGCPVARTTTVFDKKAFQDDEHAKALVARGRWRAQPNRSGRKVRISQKKTVIDDALDVISHQLRNYEQRFGYPVAQYDGRGKFVNIGHNRGPAILSAAS